MTTDAMGRQAKGTATGPSLNPQVIGQAENALRALLERTLAGTGLSYRHWIALSLAVGNDVPVAQDALIERITAVLKVDDTAAREAVADLAGEQLAETVPGDGSRVRPTDAGRKLHREVRAAIAEIVTRLFRDITADDLETAGRVLTMITARADAELAGS